MPTKTSVAERELIKTYGSLTKARRHFRVKWLEALESGKYKQNQRALRTTRPDGKSYGYCCLGVLCNLAAQEGVGEWDTKNKDPRLFKYDGEDSVGMIPDTLARVVGLTEDELDMAVEMNDHQNKSFKEIAKFFRKKWGVRKR